MQSEVLNHVYLSNDVQQKVLFAPQVDTHLSSSQMLLSSILFHVPALISSCRFETISMIFDWSVSEMSITVGFPNLSTWMIEQMYTCT